VTIIDEAPVCTNAELFWQHFHTALLTQQWIEVPVVWSDDARKGKRLYSCSMSAVKQKSAI